MLWIEVFVMVLVATTVCVTSLVWVEWIGEGRGVSVTLMVDEAVTVFVVVEMLVIVGVLVAGGAATVEKWRKMTSMEIWHGIPCNYVNISLSGSRTSLCTE